MLDQSLYEDVVFAAEAYNEYHPKGLFPVNNDGRRISLKDKVGRIICAFDYFGFALAGSC